MIHATDYLGAPALMERAYIEAVQPAETAIQCILFSGPDPDPTKEPA